MTSATDIASGEPVRLRDGSMVLIRPIGPRDGPLLADSFARLSAYSRWMRFLTAKHQLTAAELRYLTDIDHHDHEAICAVSIADGHLVGIARYIRDATDPQAAEIAVTVIDQWHHRGLATQLWTRLAGLAGQAGIHRFNALIAADNVAALTALATRTQATLVRQNLDVLEYEIALTEFSVPATRPDRLVPAR